MQLDINVLGRYWTKQMMFDLRATLDLIARVVFLGFRQDYLFKGP